MLTYAAQVLSDLREYEGAMTHLTRAADLHADVDTYILLGQTSESWHASRTASARMLTYAD